MPLLLLVLVVALLQSPAEIRAAAFDVMKAARYCTLITIEPDGQPQARIVDPLIAASRSAVRVTS